MELLLTFTLSDRLFSLLEDKLPNLGRRVEKAITKEITKQVRDTANVQINVKADTTPVAKVKAVEATEEMPKAEEQTQPITQAQTKTPTVEDCRAALKRLRIRFEGEDYETNKASEGYKKYHAQITSMIKQIVMQVSAGQADKIPNIPAEYRQLFIDECEGVTLGEDGNLEARKAPF